MIRVVQWIRKGQQGAELWSPAKDGIVCRYLTTMYHKEMLEPFKKLYHQIEREPTKQTSTENVKIINNPCVRTWTLSSIFVTSISIHVMNQIWDLLDIKDNFLLQCHNVTCLFTLVFNHENSTISWIFMFRPTLTSLFTASKKAGFTLQHPQCKSAKKIHPKKCRDCLAFRAAVKSVHVRVVWRELWCTVRGLVYN